MARGLDGSFLRYCAVSALSFGVTVGLTAALHEGVGLAEEICYAAALVTAFVLNFLFMRYWIWGHPSGELGRQAAFFACSSLAFRGAEYGVFLALHTGLGVHYLAAAISVQVASFVAKFFYYGAVVFAGRARPDGNGGSAGRATWPTR
jgi:putative flippase GtrA